MKQQMLDRSLPPKAAPLEKILFPTVRLAHLSNGVPVYLLQFGTQEIVELAAIFPAGKSFEPAASVAGFTAKMIQEGTLRRNGLEFARAIDRFGASIHVESGYESASASLTALAKHLDATVPLWAEMLLEPAFPAEELEKLRERTLQHLDVEEQKTSYVARKEYSRLLFGPTHPYGAHSEKPDISAVTLEQLQAFHGSHFHAANAMIVATGRFDEAQLLRLLDQSIGKQVLHPSQKISLSGSHALWDLPAPVTGLHYFEKAESMQATLRVGHRAFARSHPDYYAMQVVSTIIGGYFGSRLMKNIREEKGYTYGIAAAWLSMKYDGIYVVQTDVGNEYIDDTLKEIKREMRLLIDEGVTAAELDLVRNYMLGRSASSRETPGQLLGLIQNALVNDFPFEEMDRKFDIVMALQPSDIKRLALQYLSPDALLEVVCGKMQ
jgi:zinc protease